MDWKEIHEIDSRTRLVVRQDEYAELEELLGDDLAIQDLSLRDSADRSGALNYEDDYRHAIAEILNWHGGYYSQGRDAMLAGVEKTLKRAGLYYAFFYVHAYTQGSSRMLVAYSNERQISDGIKTVVQNWYSGEIYQITLETRPLACECGCLGEWEFVDSIGYLDSLDPNNKAEVVATFERNCYSLTGATA